MARHGVLDPLISTGWGQRRRDAARAELHLNMPAERASRQPPVLPAPAPVPPPAPELAPRLPMRLASLPD